MTNTNDLLLSSKLARKFPGLDVGTSGSQESELAQLLESAKRGDKAAVSQLLEQYRDFVEGLAAGTINNGLRSKLSSQDIVQQSMTEAFCSLDRFEGTTDRELRAWLAAMVRNNIVDVDRHFRLAQRRDITREVALHAAAPLPGSERTPSSHARQAETDAELRRAVAELPDKHRQLLELRHRDGLTHAEIGKRLDMTEAAARKMWSRIVEKLSNTLAPESDETS